MSILLDDDIELTDDLSRLMMPYTQSFSPGTSLGGNNLKPMAINLASASLQP